MSLTMAGRGQLSRPCGFIYCLYSRYAIALNLQLSIGMLLADQHPVRLFGGASPGQFIEQGPLQLYRVIAPLGLGQQEGTSAFRHSIATGVTSQLAYLLNPGAICHSSKTAWDPRKPGHQPPTPASRRFYVRRESRLRPMRMLVGEAFLPLTIDFHIQKHFEIMVLASIHAGSNSPHFDVHLVAPSADCQHPVLNERRAR